MTNKSKLKETMIRFQFIFLPSFIGGFLGSDLLKGEIQTQKLLSGVAIYGLINFFIYIILKSKFKND